MAKEIERRFLVKEGLDPEKVESFKHSFIEQSYLSKTGDWTIRLRKITSGPRLPWYAITMKQFVSSATNTEIEFEVSEEVYNDMLPHTGQILKKIRYAITHESSSGRLHSWEVDVYQNAPPEFQTICEIELESENEQFDIPDWVDREVTGDRSYSNAALAERLTQT